jgi:hypothetical protein
MEVSIMKEALFAILLIATPTNALAGIFFEPVLGYEAAEYRSTLTINGASSRMDLDVSGVSAGSRLGYRMGQFFFGGEYALSSMTASGGGGIRPQDIGGFAGLMLSERFRLWGGYIFSSKPKGIEGSGYKAGIGFLLLPVISLNAEYIVRDFNKLSPAIPGIAGYDGEAKGYKISLSLPFGLSSK